MNVSSLYTKISQDERIPTCAGVWNNHRINKKSSNLLPCYTAGSSAGEHLLSQLKHYLQIYGTSIDSRISLFMRTDN